MTFFDLNYRKGFIFRDKLDSMKLQNPSNKEITAAIELNSYELFKILKNIDIENLEIEENEYFFRFTSGVPFFLLNGIVDTKIPREEAETTITEIISYFKAKNLPFSWSTGPGL